MRQQLLATHSLLGQQSVLDNKVALRVEAWVGIKGFAALVDVGFALLQRLWEKEGVADTRSQPVAVTSHLGLLQIGLFDLHGGQLAGTEPASTAQQFQERTLVPSVGVNHAGLKWREEQDELMPPTWFARLLPECRWRCLQCDCWKRQGRPWRCLEKK